MLLSPSIPGLWLPGPPPPLRVTRAPWRHPLPRAVRDRAWRAFQAQGAWDGPVVRLLAMAPDHWLVAPATFRTWCESHGAAGADARDPALAPLRAWADAFTPPASWPDLLARPGWANVIGLLGFARTSDGQCWGSVRSQRVAVGRGDRTAAVTGTMEPQDLSAPDPWTAGIARETREELGVAPTAVQILGLLAAAPKWQPSVVAVADLPAPPGAGVDAWEHTRHFPISGASDLDGLSRLAWPFVAQAGR